MDEAYLLDSTLLHELTHAVPRQATTDINGMDSYGWKNCKKMSSRGSTNNAENYACFGLGSYMISARGERPLRDGTIQVLPGSGARKRDLLHVRQSTPLIPQTTNFETSSVFSSLSMSISRSSSIAASSSSKPLFGRPSTLRTSTRDTHSSSSWTKQSSSSPSQSQLGTSSPLISGYGTSSSSARSSSSLSSQILSSSRSSSSAMSSPLSSSSKGITPVSPSSGPITSAPLIPTPLGSSSSSVLIAPTPVGNTIATITSDSSTSVLPATVINVSKSGTTSPVTYVPTYTSSGDIKPTMAWMCTGPLCDTSSNCVVPLFCQSESGCGASWGLCCDWQPPSSPGGGPPAPGGPSPGPGGSESENEPSSTDTSSTETSSSITSSSSTSQSSSSEEQVVTVGPIGDRFLQWDPNGSDWYDKQQSIFAQAMADTTDAYITWIPPASASSSLFYVTSTTAYSSAPSQLTWTAASYAKTSSSSKTSMEPDTSSASSPISTAPAPSAQREYPCVYRGGPDYATGFCDCTKKVSGHTYHTTATASSGDCAIYDEFPGTIMAITTTENSVEPTPIPSPFTVTQLDGKVDVYPSQTIDIGQVYTGVEFTRTAGVGPVSTIIPPTPTEVSGNNKGSGVCHGTGDACDRAWTQFDDGRVYTQYAAYAADVYAFPIEDLTFGKGRCIAKFECEDYRAGMTGKQIKDAVEHLKEEHDASKCGTTYLSNTCHITLNYCTDCDVRH
ncbi:hypothetical protein PHISCL_06142 [Aspergillus sclerotialis]|uniref:Uncharacterized protein n=1 Tax=Aspergillus sclerotialis TaxID=2070753 RepID=A0A3A2ZED8_9EURO|nr:hypothetical protein PHISCL_06142 [Aspergillus sclerotialis]